MARPRLGAQTNPSTQAFGDAASAGTAGANLALADHKHAMMADPVTAHAAAGDPHTGYRLESADHTHASTGLQAGQIAHSALTGLTSGDDHTQYQKESEREANSGYPGLDSAGYLIEPRRSAGGYATTRNDAGGTWYTKIASGSLAAQFNMSGAQALILGTDLNTATVKRCTLRWSVNQALVFGNQPEVVLELLENEGYVAADLKIVVTSVAGPTTYEVWLRTTSQWETAWVYPLAIFGISNASAPAWYALQALNAALPAGTQYGWVSSHDDGSTDPHTQYLLESERETGTFTPSLAFATPGDHAVTYSGNRTGAYIRLGSWVWFDIAVGTTVWTHSTAAGALRVTGLPFTSGTQQYIGQVFAQGWTSSGLAVSIAPLVVVSQSYLELVYMRDAASLVGMTVANFPSGGSGGVTPTLWISGWYRRA